jgi:hypothetical protein
MGLLFPTQTSSEGWFCSSLPSGAAILMSTSCFQPKVFPHRMRDSNYPCSLANGLRNRSCVLSEQRFDYNPVCATSTYTVLSDIVHAVL